MNNRLVLVLSTLILIIVALVTYTFLNPNSRNQNKLKVVATTTQLYDFTKNLIGDNIELTTILRSNIDPHEFEPTPGDIQLISNADIIIYNGVSLEKNLDKSILESKAIKLNASGSVNVLPGEGEEESSGDPHIWFSVNNAKKIVTLIASQLKETDSKNSQVYETNKLNYILQLNNLDNYIKSKIAILPANQRKIVTNHDAFGYYIKEYGLTFIGSIIPSLSTEDQPTSSETADLINKIKEQNVKAIFTESSINPKLADQIAKEAGAKVISTLYGDTLGETGSSGDTYIKMMMYNTDEIVNALK